MFSARHIGSFGGRQVNSDDWPCPEDIEVNELVELNTDKGVVVGRAYKVSPGGANVREVVTGDEYLIWYDFKIPEDGWRRKPGMATPKSMPVASKVYGVCCSKCGDYCADAENVIGFKCYSCRSKK